MKAREKQTPETENKQENARGNGRKDMKQKDKQVGKEER